LAVNNYTYSHSLLFTDDPFTQTGLIGTLKLNDRRLINLGRSSILRNPMATLKEVGDRPDHGDCSSVRFGRCMHLLILPSM
jgi:hypothetical protein